MSGRGRASRVFPMCNQACLAYGEHHLAGADVRGRRVIEVGARNGNSPMRENVESVPTAPWGFRTARRGAQFVEKDLAPYELYWMVRRDRCRDLNRVEELWFVNRWRVRRVVAKRLPPRLKAVLKGSGTS